VLWENVPHAAKPVKQPNGKIHIGLAEILNGLTKQRYQWRVRLDNSARHGVPQNRYRLVVIGTKLNLTLPEPPPATHKSEKKVVCPDRSLKDCQLKPGGYGLIATVTVAEALSDLPHDKQWQNAGPPVKDDVHLDDSSQKRHRINGEASYCGGSNGGYRGPVADATEYQKLMREGTRPYGPLSDHQGARAPKTVLTKSTNSLASFTAVGDQPSVTIVGHCSVSGANKSNVRGWRCLMPDKDHDYLDYFTIAEFKRLQSVPDRVHI
jgi:site-specific DNA-cytosine methylase